MKHTQLIAVAFLSLALIVTGCGKKSKDQANLSGTGFDSLSSTEELAQVPQNTTSNQQGSGEVLPIETSPLTQSAGQTTSQAALTTKAPANETTAPAVSGLSREQQIQTALKNAGLYQGNIDGKIGPKTKKAIEQFQTNNNLKADGKVGPKTWVAMQQYLTGQASSSASSGTPAASTPSAD